MSGGHTQPWDSAPAAQINVGRLVEWAGRVAGMVGPGWVTEAHAVEVLADAAGRNPAVLRDAAVRAQQDPDAVPLVIALLARAARAAERPPAVRRHAPPSAPGP